jgi:hypothetical protein
VLYEEEAIAVFIALEALDRFIRDHRRQLSKDFPNLVVAIRFRHSQIKRRSRRQLLSLSAQCQLWQQN